VIVVGTIVGCKKLVGPYDA